MYDSDESIPSDDDDDAFVSDVQLQEHSDPNSYRLVTKELCCQENCFMYF